MRPVMPLGTLRNDEGFTLMELLMGLSVFVVILTVAGQLLWTATQANNVAMQKSYYTAQVAEPSNAIARNLMQATSLESVSAYGITFLVNPNLDAAYQRIAVDMSTPNGRIQMWNTNAALANTTAITDKVFTKSLLNKAQSVPAFRYYDVSGAEITDYPSVPSRVKSVRMTIRTSIGGDTSEQVQEVQLRNMFGY